jgi:Tol biopolymer transport system component
MSARLTSIVAALLALTLIAGCEAATPTPTPTSEAAATSTPAPTATPVPPTATPAPPTATPLPPHTGSGGGRIAFSSRRGAYSLQRGERNYEVVVMNADGTDVRLVTNSGFEDEGPSWSPDGTRIAYTNDNYAGYQDIYVVDVYGANERQRLTTLGNAGSPVWSPDGKYLAFSQRRQVESRGGRDLYIMAVPDGKGGEQGSADKRLLATAGGSQGIGGATWSPDGKYIACVVDETIYVLDVQEALQRGGIGVEGMRPLPRASETNDKPAWSPDGTRIAFSAIIDDHRDIYIVNVDGTGLRPLTQTRDLDEYDPAWSPDGTRIVFQANPDANWDIFIMAVSDEPATDMTGWLQLTTDVANDVSPAWAP